MDKQDNIINFNKGGENPTVSALAKQNEELKQELFKYKNSRLEEVALQILSGNSDILYKDTTEQLKMVKSAFNVAYIFTQLTRNHDETNNGD